MLFLPSTIQTILSAPEIHRVMRLRARGLYHRSGIRFLSRHPAPKVIKLYGDYNITARTASRILS